MHPISHFRTRLNDLRATMKLRALIADLNLQAHFLDQGIHDEERRTGIFDVEAVTYSTLARSQRSRRDNLLATISMLESRLAEVQRETRLETNYEAQATQSSAMA